MRELDLLRISTKKKPREIETSEQAALIEWSWLVRFKDGKVGEYITHVPNEGKRGGKAQSDFKKLGGSKGYPDLIIDIAAGGYHGLRIEMKSPRGFSSSVSKEQKEWIERLSEQGYLAVICYGFEEAKQVIVDYLGIGKDE
ncbi:VRR-NUC domain-containing protein [Vibrio plantisponsor]|uniref:VRR-NUC domain-containing protein n=1 Tax=Vibrio plantisponsor TaxID=664643 RepID=UPI00370BAC17